MFEYFFSLQNDALVFEPHIRGVVRGKSRLQGEKLNKEARPKHQSEKSTQIKRVSFLSYQGVLRLQGPCRRTLQANQSCCG